MPERVSVGEEPVRARGVSPLPSGARIPFPSMGVVRKNAFRKRKVGVRRAFPEKIL